MTRRIDRVNVLLRQEIGRVLTSKLKDPRLSSVLSVTRVDTSPDLKRARVFVSVLGDERAKHLTLRALRSAAGFIHKAVRRHLTIKTVPALEFHIDESIEQGAEMLRKIRALVPGDPAEEA